jgi:hypothetical protein
VFFIVLPSRDAILSVGVAISKESCEDIRAVVSSLVRCSVGLEPSQWREIVCARTFSTLFLDRKCLHPVSLVSIAGLSAGNSTLTPSYQISTKKRRHALPLRFAPGVRRWYGDAPNRCWTPCVNTLPFCWSRRGTGFSAGSVDWEQHRPVGTRRVLDPRSLGSPPFPAKASQNVQDGPRRLQASLTPDGIPTAARTIRTIVLEQ